MARPVQLQQKDILVVSFPTFVIPDFSHPPPHLAVGTVAVSQMLSSAYICLILDLTDKSHEKWCPSVCNLCMLAEKQNSKPCFVLYNTSPFNLHVPLGVSATLMILAPPLLWLLVYQYPTAGSKLSGDVI